MRYLKLKSWLVSVLVGDLGPSAAERCVDDCLQALEAVRASVDFFLEFITLRFGRTGDSLENFDELDLAIVRLMWSYGECCRKIDRITDSLAEEEESSGSADQDSNDWAEAATGAEERIREILLQLDVEDVYYHASYPGSGQTSEARISEDLGEVFADCRNAIPCLDCVEDEHFNPALARAALSEIQHTFEVHTIGHLLDLQKVVAWNAGKHIR